jgi:hypothetical protein
VVSSASHVAALPPSPKRPTIPGERQDVSRMEFENIEAVVRSNAERLTRLEQRLDTISRQIAELTRLVGARFKS